MFEADAGTCKLEMLLHTMQIQLEIWEHVNFISL